MSPEKHIPKPPQPPKIEQRANLSRGQMIGLPLMLLVPILALFGVFGVSEDDSTREGESVEVAVHYSSRTRYMAQHDLVIEVHNQNDAPLENVTVELDRSFVDSFAEATFIPSVDETNGISYLFDLGTIPGSASKIVSGRLSPGKYWSNDGNVTVSTAAGETVQVEFPMFVFP